MTALAAQTPSGGWRSGTTGKVRTAGTIIDIIDNFFILLQTYNILLRFGAETLEGNGRKSKTSNCALACSEGG